MDFERAAKLSGARFVAGRGASFARPQRAIAQLMLDLQCGARLHRGKPPFIVNARGLFGTGQLPKFKADPSTTAAD